MGPMGGRRPRRRARAWRALLVAIWLCAGAAAGATPARAVDLSTLLAPDIADSDWISGADVFAGMDVTESALFSYGGVTLAPAGLDRDGLRVRLYAGSGFHGLRSSKDSAVGLATFDRRADVVQAEALIGWQLSTGPMTARLFAGVAYEEQAITPVDWENPLAGAHVGAKAALETWVDLATWAWLSVDVSYATTFDAYSGAVKLGLRPVRWLSLGPEARAFGDRAFDGHRLGGFARWHCGSCDVTVSGGVAGNYDAETGAYGALSFYRRF